METSSRCSFRGGIPPSRSNVQCRRAGTHTAGFALEFRIWRLVSRNSLSLSPTPWINFIISSFSFLFPRFDSPTFSFTFLPDLLSATYPPLASWDFLPNGRLIARCISRSSIFTFPRKVKGKFREERGLATTRAPWKESRFHSGVMNRFPSTGETPAKHERTWRPDLSIDGRFTDSLGENGICPQRGRLAPVARTPRKNMPQILAGDTRSSIGRK